ncbi:putative mediator of RNA polymerase II transcription subunit 14 [Nannochloris sp. 'desiccata']|nr:putative mediator of RNA polymerase II transcription subunit 14 [Chlorella desiccata (nom. nud.)]
MTTTAPFTSLRLVQLDHLIENATEEAYKDLQNIASSLLNQSDDAKKRSLLQHLNATKQRLHRLQILLQWCHKASAVAECKRVLEVSSTHASAFREAADQLVYIHGELIHSKAPVYDVFTAIHVLSSGGYAALPTIIESELKVVAPGKGKTNTITNGSTTAPEQLEKGKAALRRLNFLIRSKLLEEGLPTGMRVERVSGGEVVVSSTSKQYTATISLVPAPSTEVTLAKWTPPEGTLDLVPADQQQEQEQEIAQPIKQEEKKDGGCKKEEREKIAAMDIDGATKDGAIDTRDIKNIITKAAVSEASLWRWRLISFQLLPTHPPALLPPHLVPWLIRNVEDRMWAASDIQQLIKLGKAGLVVVPPPPMTRKQRERKQKEIDEKGQKGLLPASLSLSRSFSAQQPSGSLPAGGAMSGSSEHRTTTTGADDGAAEAGSPGVIPIWAQSPLAALHAVLQHASAKLAIGSVLMEEARALENGLRGANTTRGTFGDGAGAGGGGGWSNGSLRISKLEDKFGIRFTLWSRVPLLSTSELTGILLDGPPKHGIDDDGQGKRKYSKAKSETKVKGEEEIQPSLGWIVQVEVPPPAYEADEKKAEERAAIDKTEVKRNKKKDERPSDGTITCVCVPPLGHPGSLREDSQTSLSVWNDDGSLSTENLLLRASAQHAQVHLAALQSLMTKQRSEAKHAQQLDEVLGVDTWQVDLVDTRSSSRTRVEPAMPALQCSFDTHAMLLLHFRPTDGQPILSLGPFLTESGIELASETENIVTKAQSALNKRLEGVLTEVLPVGITRALLWITTITEAVVETWKHLVALQRREIVLKEALGYGFGRAVLPRCLEGVELVSGGASSGGGDNAPPPAGAASAAGVLVSSKETTAVLRAPYFVSPTLPSPLKESVPMGKQGSLVCYILADMTSATEVATTENFGKQLRLALCWATPRGVPTGLRRILPVPVEMLVSSQTGTGKGTDDLKNTPPQQKGAGKATPSTKRKRQDEANDEEDATKASLSNTTDFSGVRGINWEEVHHWCTAIIAVQQLEAQLEAADCKAEPTQDRSAVRVSLATIPWVSSSSISSSFLKFSDEEIQFSLDPGRMSSPEEGAFLATFIGEKFSFWKNELEKHGLLHSINIEGDLLKNGRTALDEKRRAPSFEKIKRGSESSSGNEKIIVKCVLKDGKYSAGEMVAKAVSVGATTTCAVYIATALQQERQMQRQEEKGRYIVSVHSVDLDKIQLKHIDNRVDSRGIGGAGTISITVQWCPCRGGKDIVSGAAGAGSAGAAGAAVPSGRRVMTGGLAPPSSQSLDITTQEKSTAEAMRNSFLECCVSSSPPLPPPLLAYLENQLSVESSFEAVSTFLSVLTSVAASAAVVQAVVLDPVAQHAAGLLPGAVTVEMFSFQPATASAPAAVSAAAAGVCRLLVHQLGRSLQLHMVFESSGAVMLRARQLPPRREHHPAIGGDEKAWLQEAWSRIALQTSVITTTSGAPDEWNHVLVTLLPEQLGPVLTSLLHAVARKEYVS